MEAEAAGEKTVAKRHLNDIALAETYAVEHPRDALRPHIKVVIGVADDYPLARSTA